MIRLSLSNLRATHVWPQCNKNETKIMVLLLNTEKSVFRDWRWHDASSSTHSWGFLLRHSSINPKGKINSKLLSNLLLSMNQNMGCFFFPKHPFPKAFLFNINKLPKCLCLSEDDEKQSPDVKKHTVVKKRLTHTHTHNGYKKNKDNIRAFWNWWRMKLKRKKKHIVGKWQTLSAQPTSALQFYLNQRKLEMEHHVF